MVDRVELHLPDEVEQVRELHGQHAVRLEQQAQASDEVVDVGNVGKDVIRDQQVRGPALRGEPSCGSHPEKSALGRHAPGHGGGGDVARRLDAQRGNAAGKKILEQIAVVARYLDDKRSAVELEPFARFRGKVPAMSQPAFGYGREVGIVDEDLLGRGDRIGLDQEAGVACAHMKGIEPVAFAGPRGRDEGIGEGLQPEVEEGARERSAAGAARRHIRDFRERDHASAS